LHFGGSSGKKEIISDRLREPTSTQENCGTKEQKQKLQQNRIAMDDEMNAKAIEVKEESEDEVMVVSASNYKKRKKSTQEEDDERLAKKLQQEEEEEEEQLQMLLLAQFRTEAASSSPTSIQSLLAESKVSDVGSNVQLQEIVNLDTNEQFLETITSVLFKDEHKETAQEKMQTQLVSEVFTDEEFPANMKSLCGSAHSPDENEIAVPRCHCGLASSQMTVHRSRVNVGRKFWSCAKRLCKFFRWATREEWLIPRGCLKFEWRRPPKWPSFPSIVNGRFKARDIFQGRIGDCWFMSALSVLAQRQDLLEKLFITKKPLVNGGPYQIRLFIDAQWRTYIVDDQFPCWKKEAAPRLNKRGKIKANQNEDFRLAYCKATDNQLWVPLLEKAYAKAHQSYSAISGGWVEEAMFDLTGCPTETICVGSKELSEEELFLRLLSFHDAGFPMGASCARPQKGSGIVGRHAYGILDLRTTKLAAAKQTTMKDFFSGHQEKSESVDGSKEKTSGLKKFIRLRNPWGRHEWRGRFARHSPEWTPALRKELDHSDEDDGTFWMLFEDFLVQFCFGSISVCKAPLPKTNWFVAGVQTSFVAGQWIIDHVIEVTTPNESTWLHLTACQGTKRGKADGKFSQCDVGILIADKSAENPVAISLPGRCKTHHFSLHLRANASFKVYVFSLARSAGVECHFNLSLCVRFLSSRVLTLKKKTWKEGAVKVRKLLHASCCSFLREDFVLKSQFPQFRKLNLNGPAAESKDVGAFAFVSVGACILFAMNFHDSMHAHFEVKAFGADDEGTTNNDSVHVVGPGQSKIIVPLANNNFQDYELLGTTQLLAGSGSFFITDVTVFFVTQPSCEASSDESPLLIDFPQDVKRK